MSAFVTDGPTDEKPTSGGSSERVDTLPLTGERTVPGLDIENYWFRRHEVVYQRLADRCTGRDVLEAGFGEGYGADLLAGVSLYPQVLLNVRLRPGQDWTSNARLAQETRAVEAELAAERGKLLVGGIGAEQQQGGIAGQDFQQFGKNAHDHFPAVFPLAQVLFANQKDLHGIAPEQFGKKLLFACLPKCFHQLFVAPVFQRLLPDSADEHGIRVVI